MHQIRSRVLSLVKNGAFTAAVTAAADFARRNPGMAECYGLLAQAEEVAGYTKAAIKSVSKAIALAPQEPVYRLHRGRLYLAANEAAKALDDMNVVLETAKVASSAHYIEVAVGYRDEALKSLQLHDRTTSTVRNVLRSVHCQGGAAAA